MISLPASPAATSPSRLRLRRAILLMVIWSAIPALVAAEPDTRSSGTVRMAQRLQTIIRGAGTMMNPFANAARIEATRQQAAAARTPVDRLRTRILLATELLNAGRNAESAREYGELLAEARRNRFRIDSRSLRQIQMDEAIAWLRLGEQVNCRQNHTPESCLLPIRGGGVHRFPEGSTKGRDLLLKHLQRFPSDLAGKWLLNVAIMTLGQYPDQVPERFRIPPSAFASDYPLPRFPNVAETVGVQLDDLAGGTVLEDFNGDGWLDVLLSSWDWSGQLRYFQNRGDGTFVEQTKAAGLLGLLGGLNMVQGDYNNDGHPDVFILRGAWMGGAGRHPNSLLQSNGDGTFADVTEAAGLLSFHPTQTAVWFDSNNDGWLDLFIGNESHATVVIGTSASGDEEHPCELFVNNRDGTFTEAAAIAGTQVNAFVKGVAAGDFNNDGRIDLYVSCLGQPNKLLRNDGPLPQGRGRAAIWHFTDVAATAGVSEPLMSFPTWFFDYDNDGWLDIFVAGYKNRFGLSTMREVIADFLGQPARVEKPRLYHNNHDGTFANVAAAANLDTVLYAMGANFGDLDNDGWLDFYIGTGDPNLGNLIPNRMFRNDAGRRFQDVTTAGGFGNIQKGHGIGFGDLNNDGFQDVVANIGGAYTGDNYRKSLFANPGNSNHWLTLQLRGVKSNPSAIGARVKVVVKTKNGLRSIYKTVGSGGSFGASPLRAEIGLGAALQIESAEIYWPATGQTQRLSALVMDQFYGVREGQTNVVRLSRDKFNWPKVAGDQPHHHAHEP